VQTDAELFRIKRPMRDGLNGFSNDVVCAAAVGAGGFFLLHRRDRLNAFDGQFRLTRFFFFLG